MTTEVDPLDSGVVDWVFDGRLAQEGWGQADLRTLAHVLSRPCPHCKAQPGQWCETQSGRLIKSLDDLHVARRLPGFA